MIRASKDLASVVKQHFAKPDTLKYYTAVGLFSSEEQLIEKFFEPESTVLDIGCGTGRTTIPLIKNGFKTIAIDLSPEMIAVAKDQANKFKVNGNFEVMDALEMSFRNQSFHNAFFSFNGFEQVPGKKNREKILRNVFSILKNRGCFIFTARSGLAFCSKRFIAWALILFAYLYQRFIKGNSQWEFGDKIRKGNYVHYLNPFQIKTLVQNMGFEVLYFNSEKNFLKKKRSSFWTNFSGDRMLYYVLRKKSGGINQC